MEFTGGGSRVRGMVLFCSHCLSNENTHVCPREKTNKKERLETRDGHRQHSFNNFTNVKYLQLTDSVLGSTDATVSKCRVSGSKTGNFQNDRER